MPTVICLIGPPGAGKTTWRTTYLAHLGTVALPVVISSDDVIEAQARAAGLSYWQAFGQVDFAAIERRLDARFRQALAEDQDIIIDRTNVTPMMRQRYLALIPKHYHTMAVVFTVSRAELHRRVEARARTGKVISTEVVDYLLSIMIPPGRGEFDDIIPLVCSDQPMRDLS